MENVGTNSTRNLSVDQIKSRYQEEELTYEEATRKTYPGMDGFDWALGEVKQGTKMSRLTWDEGEFIFLVPGSNFKVNRAPLLGIYEEGTEINYQPHIDKCMQDGTIMAWNPSNEELLAMDWIRV